MKRSGLLKTVVSLSLICGVVGVAAAQEQGYWRASSNTAKSITGDIALSDTKIVINNFYSFLMARVRVLEPAELGSIFDVDTASISGQGVLYRLNIPASQKFLRKNSLCGSDDTTWMLVFASGRSMRVAFFSGERPPVFTFEAMQSSTQTCGTFAYTR